MTEAKEPVFRRARRYGADRAVDIWDNLFKDNLWKRILKNTIATTTLVIICLIPGTRVSLGRAAYLGAITTVFGHPGRRFGQMAEALILALSGTLLAVSWSTLGIYLGSLVIKENPAAAYTIRALFLVVVVLVHGYLRSKTPRLFNFVLLLIICSVVSLSSTATEVTSLGATQILYPILIAVGVIIVVNITIFPEFSSQFLGKTTIETLDATAKALENAGEYFVGPKTPVEKSEPVGLTREKTGDKIDDDLSVNGEEGPSKAKRKPLLLRVATKVGDFVYSQSSSADDTDAENSKALSVSDLTAVKAAIRKNLADCKAAQSECNFELAVSVLPPKDLKQISVHAMKNLVANTIAVISACESRFALLGEEEGDEQKATTAKQEQSGSEGKSTKVTQEGPEHSKGPEESNMPENNGKDTTKELNTTSAVNLEKSELEQIKPRREIEFGDARLLQYLLKRIAEPYRGLHSRLARTIEVVSACVAYVYDVPKLPSGLNAPTGIVLEELDVYMDDLKKALTRFDLDAASALEGVSVIQELDGQEPDIMPREEVFLICSFLLNVRQAGAQLEEMLDHSRELVSRRQERHGRHRIYFPRIKWSNWLTTGGEEVEALPKAGRKANRKGDTDDTDDDDVDAASMNSKKGLLRAQTSANSDNVVADAIGKSATKGPIADKDTTKEKSSLPKVSAESLPFSLRLRGKLADAIEWAQDSEDLLYALKLNVAVFLVLWPAFVAKWNTWYSLNRGLWAALQLILITEVSIGTAIHVFMIRGIGTTLGCLWGWAAVEARGENRIVCAVMVCIGIVPCAYVQLGSKYPKAGIVGIVSICVVSLASELETVPGTPTQNYLKRYIAFMIGGVVAIIVEMVLLPVKARTRLVESLAAALHQISNMEKCIASGIEEGTKFDIFSAEIFERFEQASSKANTALTAAETFLPFCSNEPRIKGSFEGLALIYGEFIFVLHQIVDRMENMLQLRTVYGSGPLEDLNADIYPYRRNVAGTVTLTLFAIHGALTTKLALPQFLPSARLAHLRLINRVREVVLEKVRQSEDSHELTAKLARQRAVRRKYLAWNASSAAQAEIIEFLEELIDLSKLLVGSNEIQSGLLTRQTYLDYAAEGHRLEEEEEGEGREQVERRGEEKASKSGDDDEEAVTEARDEFRDSSMDASGMTRRRRGTTLVSTRDIQIGRRRGTTVGSKGDMEDIPASLKRIQSRKAEAGLQRQRTNENGKLKHEV